MGIFDRFSRIVRAELRHRMGGQESVDPQAWRDASPGPAPRQTAPKAPSIPDDVARAFRTLGVEPNADRATARAAYLKALKTHHPDRHQDDGPEEDRATEASARINEAWDRLERYYDA